MYRLALTIVVCVGMIAGAALAAGPKVVDVQGLYEGGCKDAKGTTKMEARVVACGKDAYKVYVRIPAGENKVTKVELDGKTEGDDVKFQGASDDVKWAASYADGMIKGTCGADCTLELKRVVRVSPTMGAKPPAGAIVLIDGENFDEMTMGKPGQEWKKLEGGAIQVPKGGMNSKRRFAGSLKVHVEFRSPLMPGATGQGRGNSGVFLPNGDEIQVLDSFGMDTYTGGGCGGLYKYKDSDAFDKFSLASAPPEQWQTYDIEYRVETKDGKPTGKPRGTVLHNGIKIHDNVELHKDARAGGFQFQDHGNPVCYRNIWVVPLEDK